VALLLVADVCVASVVVAAVVAVVLAVVLAMVDDRVTFEDRV
jgi:hypothetical protein